MLDENASFRHPRRDADASDAADAVQSGAGTALSLPEADPERIAFNLWNEGRVDEAIQFLEQEISARRARYEQAGNLEPPALSHDPAALTPVSDWRARRRTALAPVEFNAFGAPIHTIDLVAGPADAIVPHPPRRSLRPMWLMGAAVAVLGLAAAGTLWSRDAGAPPNTALAALQPPAGSEAPASAAPVAHPKPAPETTAAVKDAAPLAAAEPDGDPADTDPDGTDVPPPDEVAVSDISGDDAIGPLTTASIDPAPASLPVTPPRLPRQRPEPETAVASVEQPPAAPADDVPAADADQSPLAPPPGYGPAHAPYFDPTQPRSTLTPAEYQVLLERRAWAENYMARRRAFAERRAVLQEDFGYSGDGGVFRAPQD